MNTIKYLFFVLFFVTGSSVFAGNPVDKDTISFYLNRWPLDVNFTIKGRNIRIDKGDGKFYYPETQIPDSISELEFFFSSHRQFTIAGESITDFKYMYDQVIDLDLRRCPSLKNLTLGCIIDSMDLSGNPNLERYICNGCRFNKSQLLDLSHNPELLNLTLIQSTLTALELSKNIKLDTLICERTRIKKLDLSNNTMLSYIRLLSSYFSPQEFNSFLYSLHGNEIPEKKKECLLLYIYPLKIDWENGFIWNENEKVSFDKNILKEKKWW